VWLPPGGSPWSTRRTLAATPALSRVLLADPRAFPTFMPYGANVERAQPTDPHWYLEVLSVRPEHQRQGLGSPAGAPGPRARTGARRRRRCSRPTGPRRFR